MGLEVFPFEENMNWLAWLYAQSSPEKCSTPEKTAQVPIVRSNFALKRETVGWPGSSKQLKNLLSNRHILYFLLIVLTFLLLFYNIQSLHGTRFHSIYKNPKLAHVVLENRQQGSLSGSHINKSSPHIRAMSAWLTTKTIKKQKTKRAKVSISAWRHRLEPFREPLGQSLWKGAIQSLWAGRRVHGGVF